MSSNAANTGAKIVSRSNIPEASHFKDSTNTHNSILEYEPISSDDCLRNFEKFIKSEKNDLRIFYDDAALDKRAKVAATMVDKLRSKGCSKETSKQLSILCLYDIVMLIDDSSSMSDEESGNRIKTLEDTINEITGVYDMANPNGLLSVKFINAMKGYKNIDQQRVSYVMRNRTYWGITQIGCALQKKVLDNFVFKDTMKRPLLIMTITDGEAEGESPDYVKTVIENCIEELGADPNRGKDAVAFHFSRVGNNKNGEEFLKSLDASYPNVDYVRAEYAINAVKHKGNVSKWNVLTKLLLGAIVKAINFNDEEEDDKKESNGLKHKGVPIQEEEEDEEITLDGVQTEDTKGVVDVVVEEIKADEDDDEIII